MKRNTKKQGFTLVEVLLYVAITGTTLLGISIFIMTILQSRVKNQAIAEVEQQGAQVMELISQTVRSANYIGSPATGTTANLLSLPMPDSSKDPSIIDISGGRIRIKEGSGEFIYLTSQRVIATNLIFSNLSRPKDKGSLRIQFNLSHTNFENRQELSYNRDFYASITRR